MRLLHDRVWVRRFARPLARRLALGVGLIDAPAPPPPPKPPLSAELHRSVFNVLRLLVPQDLANFGKRRVGGADDGGYVLADCLSPAQPILSLGIGPDVSFDLELAQQGHAIVMFDHTVDALPASHPNFTWHRLGVAAPAQASGDLRSLAALMALLPPSGAAPILKMDVEGAEWDVLAAADPDALGRFAQITLELHSLLRLDDAAFNATAHAALTALATRFVPIHVHANNCGPQGYVGGFALPDTLEITYIRRDLAHTVPSCTWYPTALDRSNWRGGVDYVLWSFPFAPGSDRVQLAQHSGGELA